MHTAVNYLERAELILLDASTLIDRFHSALRRSRPSGVRVDSKFLPGALSLSDGAGLPPSSNDVCTAASV